MDDKYLYIGKISKGMHSFYNIENNTIYSMTLKELKETNYIRYVSNIVVIKIAVMVVAWLLLSILLYKNIVLLYTSIVIVSIAMLMIFSTLGIKIGSQPFNKSKAKANILEKDYKDKILKKIKRKIPLKVFMMFAYLIVLSFYMASLEDIGKMTMLGVFCLTVSSQFFLEYLFFSDLYGLLMLWENISGFKPKKQINKHT